MLHIIFRTFVLELWPLIYADFCFRLISLEKTDRFSLNFIYSFILPRSRFMTYCNRVMALDSCQNFFRTNGQNLTKLYICIYIVKIRVNRIFTCSLSQICNKVMALDWQHNLFLLNILSKNGQNFTKFCKCIKFIRSMLRLLSSIFCLFVTEL